MRQNEDWLAARPAYWVQGDAAQRITTALTGLIAIFVAVKAAAWAPETAHLQFHEAVSRTAAYCALTVWLVLSFGFRRRGAATALALVFAAIVELVVMPARVDELATLSTAAGGIALGFLGLQVYLSTLVAQARQKA